MRVALEKVDGIAGVSVTLKRGVAHITLKPGNTVTLAELRRIIKQAGYVSREADVTVVGTVRSSDSEQSLTVRETGEVFELFAAEGASPADVERAADRMVEITGTITAPEGSGRERMRVQQVSPVR